MEFLRELLHELHIDPPVILVNIIGFLILLALMRKFFFGPIRQFLADREDEVAQWVESTESAEQQAEQELSRIQGQRQEMLDQAQQEANETRQQAQQQSDELLDETRQQALEREQRAEEHIRESQERALAEARSEIAGLSTELAQRALGESLKDEEQQQLLEAALRDVEEIARRNSEQV